MNTFLLQFSARLEKCKPLFELPALSLQTRCGVLQATTPYRARQEELREEARRDALRAAEEAAAGAADLRDLGPFYGLPSRVQQLLQEHKGISQLYGMCRRHLRGLSHCWRSLHVDLSCQFGPLCTE